MPSRTPKTLADCKSGERFDDQSLRFLYTVQLYIILKKFSQTWMFTGNFDYIFFASWPLIRGFAETAATT